MSHEKPFDQSVYPSKRLRREESDEFLPSNKRRREGNAQNKSSYFKHAQNFSINESTFIENRAETTINFLAGKRPGPMLKHIMKCADLDALVDSSARFPPPTCHPGTRLKIGDKLFAWLDNLNRQCNLTWLTGPAATGKSAVAQTLAERCAKEGRLGASFFFSRPNKRNNPDTVIPTLIYQLAVCQAPYKSLVMAQLADDPAILQKARHVQFQKLIVEPFLQLQAQEQQRIQKPLLVVLDGLDECNGVGAQREIVQMIGEVVRQKQDLPLVWLICSRPEPHLTSLFSRADFTAHCGRGELKIDAESIAEVACYLRNELNRIKDDFPHVTTATWPPEDKIVELSEKASGHFGFASISLRYIGDWASSSPMSRLDNLLSFLSGVKVGTSNPLEALDALYTGIFEDIPNDILPTTMQILGFTIFLERWPLDTVQGRCNFLHIDQATFHNAFQKLHSVIDIPPPESASKKDLYFYHASFEDYLKDPSRSGKFAIKEDNIRLNRAKVCFSWEETRLELFHTTDGPVFNDEHEDATLPGLLWVSDDNRTKISQQVVKEVKMHCWDSFLDAKKPDETLLSQIRNFDFRQTETRTFDEDWYFVVNKLWEIDSLSGIVRTAPCTELDLRLLEYMKSMVGPLRDSTPATFPLNEGLDREEYFFIGYGYKVAIYWGNPGKYDWYNTWHSDKPPTKKEIDAYQTRFWRR